MSSSLLLLIDAAINFLLGVLLLLTIPFPDQIPRILGVPAVGHSFYTSLFGAVLIGIGIALVLETKRKHFEQMVGLGLAGATAINLCGGTILIAWLIFGDLQIPVQGKIFLWLIGGTLIIISVLELVVHRRR
jgi:hypothetical protein